MTIGAAFAATIATGTLKMTLAVVLGKIFGVVSASGNGELTAADTLSQVSTWCLVLCAMGGGAMISNAAFLALWIIFGELQAKTVRDTVFSALLKKNMVWYDTRDGGIASLLIRIEM